MQTGNRNEQQTGKQQIESRSSNSINLNGLNIVVICLLARVSGRSLQQKISAMNSTVLLALDNDPLAKDSLEDIFQQVQYRWRSKRYGILRSHFSKSVNLAVASQHSQISSFNLELPN